MSYQQKSLRNLSLAYISAFVIVIVLAIISQTIIHIALNQEVISRQVGALTTQRIIYSQRLQRNTVLLIGTQGRTEVDKELASDLAALQSSAATFKQNYPNYAAEVKAALPLDATVQYHNVITAGTKLVQLEKQYAKAPYKARLSAEGQYITLMFYSETKQLGYLQKVQEIVDNGTDAYIASISRIEWIIFGLNMLVWLYELFVVLIPTTRRIALDLKQPEEAISQSAGLQA